MSAAGEDRLPVVLCWLMHQPCYRDLARGEALEPWAYLRGIKDYVDMAVHVEAVPGACAVFAFSPVLLGQLDEYSSWLAAHLRAGSKVPDPALALLTPGGVPEDRERWPALVRLFLQAQPEHMISRFAAYRDLAAACRDRLAAGTFADAPRGMLTDLAAWFHLAWLGESVRVGDPRVKDLAGVGRDFRAEHLRSLLECVADVLAGLLPRYRRLAGSGKAELAVAPWGHPLLPLLLDFESALDDGPGPDPPAARCYPGGAGRARWHVARAIQSCSRHFGIRPRGCLPPEGALCARSLELLESFGFDWTASGEQVLARSLGGGPDGPLYVGHRAGGGRTVCFFRDDELSDLIGFAYNKWDGDEAAADLVRRLERSALSRQGSYGRHVATILLEGDVAWESYPRNGWEFLSALYQRLSMHPRLQLTTFSRCLKEGVEIRRLDHLVAGSSSRGSLASWTGTPASGRAWEQLCRAKRVFDRVVVEGALDEERQRRAELQLGVCEGSDWFRRAEDEGPPAPAGDLEAIFRRHLANLYLLLGEPAPADLGPGAAAWMSADRPGGPTG